MCCSSPSSFRAFEKRQGPAERPLADLVEREVAEPDGRGVVAEPGPHARRARDVVNHPLELEAIDERDPPGLLDRREQSFILEREPGLIPGRGDVEPGVARRRGG